MNEHDEARTLLSPLRLPWEHADHRDALEARIMRNHQDRKSSRRRFFLTGGLILTFTSLAAALPGVRDWWAGWSTTEVELPDGRTHLVVTDPDGVVDFDQVLEPGESVFQTDEGEYMIVEPEDTGADSVGSVLEGLDD